MHDQMSKTELLETLRARRGEWDAVLANIPSDWMTEPGVAGSWSVKDIIAHLTYYERWIADRLHEQLHGVMYGPTAEDAMNDDQRNDLVYQRTRHHAFAQVLDESRKAFDDLISGVESHSEAFLIEPQQFEGAPQPVIIWQLLRGEVYDHYGQHIPTIQQWLAARRLQSPGDDPTT